MGADGYRRALKELLARAGVGVDGQQPWDIRVLDPRMFRRVLADGSVGAGESYMDGWWDCARLDEMLRRVFSAGSTSSCGPGARSLPDCVRGCSTRKRAIVLLWLASVTTISETICTSACWTVA